ncbi:MAG: hypothetical protein ABFS37_16770 [Acidobacteriota bacterium]
MRRWMIVLVIAALAVAIVALPSAAKERDLPDPINLEGYVAYGAIEARTGEYAGGPVLWPVPVPWDHLMDPAYNRCAVASATLTWIEKNTALLDTVELCPPWRGPLPSPTEHHKIVHITHGGAVKMSPAPGPVMWPMLPKMTGCDLNGTFPIYHGHFDGEHFYAAAHYNSICDGGTGWSKFGISAESGPIHVTYEFSLDVVGD